MTVGVKQCRRCGETKPVDQYHSKNGADKTVARCKDCMNQINRDRRLRNRVIGVYEEKCVQCGELFTTKSHNVNVCSDECRKKRHRERSRVSKNKIRRQKMLAVGRERYWQKRNELHRVHVERQEKLIARMGATTGIKFGKLVIYPENRGRVKRVPVKEWKDSGLGLIEFVEWIMKGR